MSYFDNLRYEAEDGIYFEATIGEVTQLMYLDISLLEDLGNKKIIHGRPTALAVFRSCEGAIYRMTLKAINDNPSWDNSKPLPLLRSYLTF